MLKKILLVVAALIVVFVIVVSLQPNDFRISRSTTIGAPAAVVFPHVNDFHQWSAWSPWENLDPKMKRTFSGPASGVGSVYAWDGNSQVGAGQMTITESRPGDLIAINLEFTKPMADRCPTEFKFEPSGGQTRVTWTMSGKYNFISKAMCLFMSMDKMVGTPFEQGLAKLKQLSEAEAKR